MSGNEKHFSKYTGVVSISSENCAFLPLTMYGLDALMFWCLVFVVLSVSNINNLFYMELATISLPS